MEDKTELQNLLPVHQQQMVMMSEREKKIKEILALNRVIREGCKPLPLICPDRNKPRPFQLSAKG